MYTDKIIPPFHVDIDLGEGVMAAPDRHLVRRASDMLGYYADPSALQRLIDQQHDPLHYEVFEKQVPEEQGQLLFCISRLQPGLVGEEYYMTKGHFHGISGTAEAYLGIRGRGYLLLKTAAGECVAEPICRGRLVYVPPHWAHRSINTGQEPLVSLCIWPAEAGHNYGDIVRQGFPKRIFCHKGLEAIEKT